MALTFVSYNDKSTAKRGVVRKNPLLKGSEDQYLRQFEGKWGFHMEDDEPQLPPDENKNEDLGVLNNMAGKPATPEDKATLEAAVEDNPPATSAFGSFAMAQLTANHTTPEPTTSTQSPTSKIERNRPESNGVKHPSAGTACAKVWEIATAMQAVQGAAKLGEVVKTAEAAGVNKFTARTQYARWRVFHGITGRAA